jgi:4-amino-4-deoxy-L-arabinose transferase-like glycosyltransferase
MKTSEYEVAPLLARGPGSPIGVYLSTRSHLLVAAVLCVLAFLVRLPWYFVDVIDIDEGTSVLMGQSLAVGHLPYTEVWDNKPPLGFVPFALVQLLFPHSLAFIRLSGTLLVAATAFLVFRISRRFSCSLESLLGAVLAVVAISIVIPSGEAVMMEHVAMLPLLGALTLAIRGRYSFWNCIAIGALLGTAALVRMNLAIPAVAVVIAVLAIPKGTIFQSKLASGLAVGLGGSLVLLASYLPYALSGHSSLYMRSVFTVPLAYAASKLGFVDTLLAMIGYALPSWDPLAENGGGSLKLLLWTGGAVGLIAPLLIFQNKERVITAMWLVIFCTTVCFSILLSGHAWGHYLIQAAPFFAIGVAALPGMIRLSRTVVAAVIISILLFSAVTVWPTYGELIGRWRSGASLYTGETFALAEYLQLSENGDKTYFFSGDILPYWILNRSPIIPIAAFPHNILRVDEIVRPLYGRDYDTERLIGELFAKCPTIVVTREGSPFLEFWPSFSEKLEAHYTLTDRFRNWLIFRRK